MCDACLHLQPEWPDTFVDKSAVHLVEKRRARYRNLQVFEKGNDLE